MDFLVGRLSVDPVAVTGLRQIRLYDEPVRLVVRRGHPALDLAEPVMEDLVGYPWILPNEGLLLRDELNVNLAARGIESPADIIECVTILTIKAILVATDAVAPLPMLIGAQDEALDLLPIPLESVPRTIGITHVAGGPVSESARALIHEVRRVATDLDGELRALLDPADIAQKA